MSSSVNFFTIACCRELDACRGSASDAQITARCMLEQLLGWLVSMPTSAGLRYARSVNSVSQLCPTRERSCTLKMIVKSLGQPDREIQVSGLLWRSERRSAATG